MKKILLFFALALFLFQEIDAKKIFVEMEFHKSRIRIDDGTNKESQPLRDEQGNDLKFISLAGALNYMSLLGWELIDTKSVTKGDVAAGYGDTDTKVYYIFSKEVSDEELEEAVKNSYKE